MRIPERRDITCGINSRHAGAELVINQDSTLVFHWEIAMCRQRINRSCTRTDQNKLAGQQLGRMGNDAGDIAKPADNTNNFGFCGNFSSRTLYPF